MTPAARERSQVRAPMLSVSAAAWILLALDPGGLALHAHNAAMPGMPLAMALAHNSPVRLALGWAVMLAAMMAPLTIAPVRHVRDRSFARRRARAIALFAAGYGAVWMAAGAVLVALALAVRIAAPESILPLAVAGLIALAWQCSPVKQRCLNRGHGHPELAAFGRAADLGALRFGLTHGVWCAGSCWAAMLLPLVAMHGHFAAMAAVTVWLSAERLESPAWPQWGLRFPGRAARMVWVQLLNG